MNVEHSPLYNDFLSFFFETAVDGRKLYETQLDFFSLQWMTRKLATDSVVLSGAISPSKDRTEEKAEEERIRSAVTAHLLKC